MLKWNGLLWPKQCTFSEPALVLDKNYKFIFMLLNFNVNNPFHSCDIMCLIGTGHDRNALEKKLVINPFSNMGIMHTKTFQGREGP